MRHIFVFGSNTEGIHGGGAAKHAIEEYNATYGKAKGFQGDSYAIVTKDLKRGHRSIELSEIEKQVKEFNLFTKTHREMKFLVTGIGMGLAGYAIEEIVPFFTSLHWDMNVFFSHEFLKKPDNERL